MPRPTDATHPNRAAFPPGLSGPALRALATAGIASLDALAAWTEADVAALHGMGPTGVVRLREALHARGLDFARASR